MKISPKIIITLAIMATVTLASYHYAEIKIQRVSTYCLNPISHGCPSSAFSQPFMYAVDDRWSQIFWTIYMTIIGVIGLLIFALLNSIFPGSTRKSRNIEAVIKKYYPLGLCLLILVDFIYLFYQMSASIDYSGIGKRYVLLTVLIFFSSIFLLSLSCAFIAKIRDERKMAWMDQYLKEWFKARFTNGLFLFLKIF